MPSDDDTLRSVLSMEDVVVNGCSTTPGRAAHDIPAYLQRNGYTIHPVNPYADTVLGVEAVDTLGALPNGTVDVVDGFRPSEEGACIVEEVLDRSNVRAIWTQLGIRDDEAASRARDAGLTVVQDRCKKVEHVRLVGATS